LYPEGWVVLDDWMMMFFVFFDLDKIVFWLVVEPTQLNNMRKSNWIISPNRDENKHIFFCKINFECGS